MKMLLHFTLNNGIVTAIDMDEYEKTQAKIRLMSELAKGEKSGREKGRLDIDAVERNLGLYK